ncbi:hypothetical protein GSF24_00180 [Microbispora triticiradicis]|nr:hypothetical protein [Microbispora triticiradicis]
MVGVHGVGKQLLGEEMLLRDWRPALMDGLCRAGGPLLNRHDFRMSFYGDLFRPKGSTLAVGDPLFTADDVDEGVEQDLLFSWWEAAAAVDPRVAPPAGDTLARTPRSVQAALRALSGSRFFSGLALRTLVFDLKQTSRYLLDPAVRQAALDRVAALIGEDTRAIIAHSLGSVVAYETLCALKGHGVRALVTLGSPLGIRMVFDRLQPKPGPVGMWPGGDTLTWTNVVDQGDVVALVKDLSDRFGPRVHGRVIHNGSHAHDATAYLTDASTGAAIAAGLDAA